MAVSFRFGDEDLPAEQAEGAEFSPAEVGLMLFEPRLGGAQPLPRPPTLGYSVVSRICCKCACVSRLCGVPTSDTAITRAQFVWCVNVVCLIAHSVMFYLTMTACGGTRFGVAVNSNCTVDKMSVDIYRLSSAWNSSSSDGYVMAMRPNGLPVRFDLLVAWFFGLSAIAHAFVVAVGPFERLSGVYWAKIDSCFCYWRWLEYLASAPLMIFTLQLIIGLREQNTLALSWILIAATMVMGMATEAWSRPAERAADGYRGWVGDPHRSEELMNLVHKDRDHKRRNKRTDFEAQTAQTAPLSSQITLRERRLLREYANAYTLNYVRRMIPHIVGWFFYVPVWVIYFNHFLTSLSDLHDENRDVWANVPTFVPFAIGATVLWFTSFAFVQIRFQFTSPDSYWRSEVWYAILSLGSKLTLGILLYSNVLVFGSFDEALEATPANSNSLR